MLTDALTQLLSSNLSFADINKTVAIGCSLPTVVPLQYGRQVRQKLAVIVVQA